MLATSVHNNSALQNCLPKHTTTKGKTLENTLEQEVK